MIKQNEAMRLIFILFLTFIGLNTYAQDAVNQFDAEGKRHGFWKKNFDKTDQIRYEGQFDHGKEIGTFKFYTLNNKKSVLSATKEFNASNAIALVKFFSSKGKPISEGKMNGKLFIGTWTYYHNKFKTVMSIENYNDNGQLHGEKMVYYPNGQLAEKSYYNSGKLQGASIWYAEKGIILKEFTYDNGELHGPAKYYNADGELVAEGDYQRDRKHGIWNYYENGKIKETTDHTRRSKNPKKQ